MVEARSDSQSSSLWINLVRFMCCEKNNLRLGTPEKFSTSGLNQCPQSVRMSEMWFCDSCTWTWSHLWGLAVVDCLPIRKHKATFRSSFIFVTPKDGLVDWGSLLIPCLPFYFFKFLLIFPDTNSVVLYPQINIYIEWAIIFFLE